MVSHNQLVTALFGLLLATTPAWSQDISYQPPDFIGGDGLESSVDAGLQNADNFSLSGANTLTDLAWWGSYSNLDTDSFVVRIFSDTSGNPGNLLYSYTPASVGRTDTGQTDIVSAPIYRYDFHLSTPPNLSAGNYYLSIMNNTANEHWYWLFGNNGDGNRWLRDADGNSWTSASQDFSFLVQGEPITDVPEPATIWLFSLAGLASFRRLARM